MLADILGPDLLIVVIVVAVVLFGGAAIPKLARNLGSAKTEFEKGLKQGNGAADAESIQGPGPTSGPTSSPTSSPASGPTSGATTER